MGGEVITIIAIIAKIEKTKNTAEGGCTTRGFRKPGIKQGRAGFQLSTTKICEPRKSVSESVLSTDSTAIVRAIWDTPSLEQV